METLPIVGNKAQSFIMLPNFERRKKNRMALRWPVFLNRIGDTRSIESKTENLSSQGFYCISTEPFAPGERLECVLSSPPADWDDDATLRLLCLVQVMRVEAMGLDSSFGLAVKIEDFAVSRRD